MKKFAEIKSAETVVPKPTITILPSYIIRVWTHFSVILLYLVPTPLIIM
jgi:hypothetical protein